MPCHELSGTIVEPFRRTKAIPNIRACWHLPEMDVNDLDLEHDGTSVQLMMAGEERGFVALYGKYQARVYQFALRISGISHIAEDVTQEAFLALIRAPHKYQTERAPLLLYLFGIARHLVWKNARRGGFLATLDDDRELPLSQFHRFG
jgi:DNA-directed RNA polymerase specialized sigma24 family protein